MSRPPYASWLACLAVIATLLACASTGDPTHPDHVSMSGVTTVSADFLFDRSTRQAQFLMVYEFDPPVVAGTLLRSEFQNPLSRNSPFVVENAAATELSTYEVRSPNLSAIRSGETYEVILIGKKADSGEELFRHIQPMRFYLPLSVLESR